MFSLAKVKVSKKAISVLTICPLETAFVTDGNHEYLKTLNVSRNSMRKTAVSNNRTHDAISYPFYQTLARKLETYRTEYKIRINGTKTQFILHIIQD